MLRRFLIMATALVLAFWPTGMAIAATGWVVQATPRPSGRVQLPMLFAVSCGSAVSCTAVGDYGTPHAVDALVEHWDGSTWALQPVPDDGSYAPLAVTCMSADSCVSVGTGGPAFKTPMAQRWNGSTWVAEAVPSPPGVRDDLGVALYGVSCPSVTSCFAAGSYSTKPLGGFKTLAEHWNGSKWAIQATPNQAGEPDSYLSAISCASAASCTAVGWSANKSDTSGTTLAEHWDGSKWAIQAMPRSVNKVVPELGGVSCTSVTSCTAVGFAVAGSGAVAEHWNGSSWSVQPAPSPPGSVEAGLLGVSCSSAASCTAVGSYTYDGGNADHTLAEYWNGSKWVIEHTPGLGKGTRRDITELAGVSCAAPATCTAVGWYGNFTLAEHK